MCNVYILIVRRIKICFPGYRCSTNVVLYRYAFFCYIAPLVISMSCCRQASKSKVILFKSLIVSSVYIKFINCDVGFHYCQSVSRLYLVDSARSFFFLALVITHVTKLCKHQFIDFLIIDM